MYNEKYLGTRTEKLMGQLKRCDCHDVSIEKKT